MTRELFALLMAGTLLIPLITAAHGEDATTGFARARADAAGAHTLLPLQVPHLQDAPWFNSGARLKGPKVDTLITPGLETLGPFLLQPAIPSARISGEARQLRDELRTE
jgi:hypothetical protein